MLRMEHTPYHQFHRFSKMLSIVFTGPPYGTSLKNTEFLKNVKIIKTLYENSKCAVKVNNSLTDWFFIKTGVCQGGILSPLLFCITIDWIMKRSMENKTTGIKWLNNTTLEDLDFADDIALLSH